MKQILFIILLLILVAFINVARNTSSENNQKSWTVLRTDGSRLIFKDGSLINSRLYDMNYIETLKDSIGNPYFVLSGRTCSECDENIAIFIFSPKDTLKSLSELPKYVYPGKEYFYENHHLIFESKLFICNCIKSNDNSVCLVWVQKLKNNNNKFDSSMFIVDIFDDKIRERNIRSQTQEFNSNSKHLKECREIKGVDTTSEP